MYGGCGIGPCSVPRPSLAPYVARAHGGGERRRKDASVGYPLLRDASVASSSLSWPGGGRLHVGIGDAAVRADGVRWPTADRREES